METVELRAVTPSNSAVCNIEHFSGGKLMFRKGTDDGDDRASLKLPSPVFLS
jgi:hypothetical protein